MNKKYKDTDLREALRRKYADTPKLPEGWPIPTPPPTPPEGGEFRIENRRPKGKSKPPLGKVWRGLAAACLLIIVGIGLTLMYKEETAKPQQMIVKQTKPAPVPKRGTADTTARYSAYQGLVRSVPKPGTAPKQAPIKPLSQPLSREGSTELKIDGRRESQSLPSGRLEGGSNLHYAAHDPAEETVPYQDPARVDEFIEKMAAYHNVKEGHLKCAAANDSNVVSRVYVFPDKKEIDVFGRMLQVACWYSDETPGYHLNFSHLQFFFELKDQRRQLQYRWIAERINGKILLYGTNAPIGAQTSSACYQEFRNQLMHTNSINLKTREI